MENNFEVSESDIESLKSRSPGEDPEKPYEDIDISELPEWWQNAIQLFEAHGLRPFRPTQFSDGELKQTIVEELENKTNSEIRFVQYADEERWTILMDENPVGKVNHYRSPNGYSIFNIDSDSFRRLIREEHSGKS